MRKSELVVPQLVDTNAPIIFPLVDNVVRFPFENRLTLTQQDADNRKSAVPLSRALPDGMAGDKRIVNSNDTANADDNATSTGSALTLPAVTLTTIVPT